MSDERKVTVAQMRASPVAGLTAVGSTLYGTSLYGGLVDGNVFAFNLSNVVPPPTLSFQLSPGTVTLTWDSADYTLQFTSLLGTAFTNVPGAASPYFVAPTLSAGFYRLVHK